ncbi:tripartite tricarboxylate transporter TctB family protein [Ureibacillus aquaedulcis]|uniref:Tripartite tricarboxylate transporter TctB family protein n=1 Tax=Ureibacillus aquaedulcis TaxID=3058421 RepID=A0ABT8GQ63_9BACL|nr:tripartite tricarboxylate transporter TctB family protein [Ureibacillus sp. BA0131]MDN4493489.1 tripartite tricarboxylate transporter TctB family protein [Ureibacillus sp. BA0131]
MHENKSVDMISSIVLIAVSIILFIATFSFRAMTVSDIGPEFLPRIVAITLFILSISLFIKAYVQKKKEGEIQIAEEIESVPQKESKKEIYLLVITTLILIVLYLIVLPSLGFLIATTVYLYIQIYLMAPADKRNHIKIGLVSVLSSTIIYFVFRNVFYLMLPSGILG